MLLEAICALASGFSDILLTRFFRLWHSSELDAEYLRNKKQGGIYHTAGGARTRNVGIGDNRRSSYVSERQGRCGRGLAPWSLETASTFQLVADR